MPTDASAYATLGLEPGADSSAIERAYKSLIKQYHPDREGGDAQRAAEIIHAYRELKTRSKGELVLVEAEPAERSGSGLVRAAGVLMVALAALYAFRGPVAGYVDQLLHPQAHAEAERRLMSAAARADPMDQPLHLLAMNDGVRQAVTMLGRRDDAALISASRDCHRTLRIDPSIAQLDRCAAFDDAVVQMQDRDPMWDEGPFSQIAVTGRQWSGASALSSDTLAIDGRLQRIRLQVELAVAGNVASVPTPPHPDPLPQGESENVSAAP